MKIKIFTNEVSGGWSPLDLQNMLGGSEESVVLLSEAFQRAGHEVTVYHTPSVKDLNNYDKIEDYSHVHNKVKYQARESAQCYSDEVLITFKDPHPWRSGAEPKIKIHWSCEVEFHWDTSLVDHFVNISNYHQRRNLFADSSKSTVIPLGIDKESLLTHKTDKEPFTVLYCSSPDRGLLTLLSDWPEIKKLYPALKLNIAYGFEVYDKIAGRFPNGIKDDITRFVEQEDVKFLGSLNKDGIDREYWKSEYWILPLNNPDSELFCLNAVKSQFCNCIPIVYKRGALQDTVNSYIDYSSFVGGDMHLTIRNDNRFEYQSWDEIVSKYWEPIINVR